MAKLITVNPSTAMQGQTLASVQIAGQATHFDDTSEVAFSGSGVSAFDVLATPTLLTAQVAISPSADTGPMDVTVTTGSEVATGLALFAVTPAPPAAFGSLSPVVAAQGDTVDIMITGLYTDFDDTTDVAFSGSGIAVGKITVADATHLTATVAIDAAAAVATSDVTITSGSETITGTAAFRVILSSDRAEILREAVNNYLRRNAVDAETASVCIQFIADINDSLRGGGARVSVATVAANKPTKKAKAEAEEPEEKSSVPIKPAPRSEYAGKPEHGEHHSGPPNKKHKS